MKQSIIITVLLLILVSCGKDTKTYTNETYGFSIDYPADWDTSKTDPRMVFMALEPYQDSSDIFQEGFSISVFENEGYSLDEIVAENIAMTERYYAGAEINREDIKINDNEAIQLSLDYDLEDLSLTNIATFLSHNQYLITVTQSAEKKNFENYKALFDELIQTFSFIEK